jgi:hypothetical protein
MSDVVQYTFLTDNYGRSLDGGKYYRFRLPANMSPCKFWSLIVYDTETDLMIKTDQSWPSVHSNCHNLELEEDGSVDAWFGPKPQPSKNQNWLKTIPGKGWYLILRLYDIKPSSEKFWEPGEIEEMKEASIKKQVKLNSLII